jgi:hypothetical protein
LKTTFETKRGQELNELTQEEKAKFLAVEEMKEKTVKSSRNEVKNEWVKASFWMPENNPGYLDEIKPDAKFSVPKLCCPIGQEHSHRLKVKELVSLKL